MPVAHRLQPRRGDLGVDHGWRMDVAGERRKHAAQVGCRDIWQVQARGGPGVEDKADTRRRRTQGIGSYQVTACS